MGQKHSPSRGITLEIFALALKHSSANLRGGGVLLAWITNVVDSTQRQSRVDKVRITLDEAGPLVVLGYGNRTASELLDSIIGVVTLTSENTCKSVVRLLNLADDDRLELATRGFEVEVCLGAGLATRNQQQSKERHTR